MDPSVASKQGGSVSEVRDYRKGNWTVQETMVLIEAKKMDEERRMKRPSHGGDRGKPPELRWKWVEDYCWRRGCFRSQNQCNDKWDNLMRDFKKVREYEGRAAEAGAAAAAAGKSYWRIEKNERKERNLPSNFLSEIYEALMELTERKCQRFANVLGQPSMPHQVQEPPVTQAAPPTHPPPPFPPAAEQPALAFSQPLPTVDCDTSDESESPAKRRKREGTSGTASGTIRLEEVGRAISKSASIIAEAMQSCEEREGRREREMMRVHERRLEIEQSKAEINRRGINSLVDAVNKLADSILALAHHKTQQHSSK